jgi:DNA-binding XRE family transcriptional regulator
MTYPFDITIYFIIQKAARDSRCIRFHRHWSPSVPSFSLRNWNSSHFLVPRKTIWVLCFANNSSQLKKLENLGDKLRDTRMEDFMSIKEQARKLDVNECTVGKWELGKSRPRSDMLERVNAFIKAHRTIKPAYAKGFLLFVAFLSTPIEADKLPYPPEIPTA